MTKIVEYYNRYNDCYTFTLEENEIKFEGSFKWLRTSYPNVYTHAYEAYCKDVPVGQRLSLEEFESEVHSYDPDTFEAGKIAKKYASLIYSDTTKLAMVDPSGGPYIEVGMNMKHISKSFEGLIVKEIKSTKTGYLLIVKKEN